MKQERLAAEGILGLTTLRTQTEAMELVAVAITVLQKPPLVAVVLMEAAALATHQGAAVIAGG